jgi:hypothetical protein
MPKRDPSKYKIVSDVLTKGAVVASAAAAIQRGEYENPTHAAHSFVNKYYLYDVGARDEAPQYDRKVRYLAGLIKASVRRS